MYKRIISFLLVIATTVSLVAPVSALGVEIGTVASGIADFFGWVDSMYSAFESLDSTMENSGFYDALDRETSAYCSDADTATGGRYPYHRWGGAFLPSNQRCDYCGVEYSTYKALLSRGYGGFTSTLENTIVNSPMFVPDGYSFYNDVKLPNLPELSDDMNSTGRYPMRVLISFSGYTFLAGDFYVRDDYLVSSNGYIAQASFDDSTGRWGNIEYYSFSSDIKWTDAYKLIWCDTNIVDRNSGEVYLVASAPVVSGVESGDSGISESHDTRCASLTAALNEWNEKHLIESGSPTINYYISPVDTEDTYYHPGLYDEKTLVYTDPVTGMEYLTTGWTYDYLTRCYSLSMGDTFVIGDTTITRIDLTYGDDVLTVDHYDASGNLVQTDTYNYVVASGSECGLDGHSYTYENVIDATCIAPGERKFTCSVCGDEYAEEIPQIDHVYADYTVTHDPTCTSKGISSYSCSACGGEFTELLDALGHDWQPTAATEESFVMPHSVRCPDCFGTEYSYEFQDLEVKYGKNLFDLSRVKTHPPLPTATWISSVNVEEHSFVISPPTNGFAESGYRTIGVLSDLTSFLEPDTSYVITFSIESGYNFVYLVGSGRMWYSGQALILTEADLSEQITFYGNRDTDCRVEFIQIEKGSVATAYEPFDAEYIELVPPLYHFTCSSSDCGTVWTEEAEFQGASVTFSCTRCGAEKIEVEEKPIEEEGWFDWIGKQFRTLISAIVNGFASGLEFLLSEVIVTTVSWLINIVEWVFGLFDSASLTEWFNWFDDSNPAFSEWSEQTVWGS